MQSAEVCNVAGGVTMNTLKKWMDNPDMAFPKPRMMTKKMYWLRSDVIAWIKGQRENISMGLWHSIETAPKNKKLLVWYDHAAPCPKEYDQHVAHGIDTVRVSSGWCVAYWDAHSFLPFWREDADEYPLIVNATHWMYLPQKPDGAE